MLHGRFVARCQSATRWSLFLLLLIASAGVVEALGPFGRPRWTIPGPAAVLYVSHDGTLVATAGYPPSTVNFAPPLKVHQISDGRELGTYFRDAAQIYSHGFVPADPQTVLMSIQHTPGAVWKTYLVNAPNNSVRTIPIELPGTSGQFVRFSPKAPIAVFVQTHFVGNPGGDGYLVDLQSAKILHRWTTNDAFDKWTFTEKTLFLAQSAGQKWIGTFWDVEKNQARCTTERVDHLYVSADRRHVITAMSGDETLHWKIRTIDGEEVSEHETTNGRIFRSEDARWGIVAPFEGGKGPRWPAEVWNLREQKKVGSLAADSGDHFEFIHRDGKLCLLARRGGLDENKHTRYATGLFDVETLKPIWERNWDSDDQLRTHASFGDLPQTGPVALVNNHAEFLDLATGETRRWIALASPRFDFEGEGKAGPGVRSSVALTKNKRLVLKQYFAEKQPSAIDRLLAKLKLKPASTGVYGSVHVLDPAAQDELFRSRRYVHADLSQANVCPGECEILVTASDHEANSSIECWDMPLVRTWHWTIIAPLLLGMIGTSARFAWRWRHGP
jgi:hypothetical protein